MIRVGREWLLLDGRLSDRVSPLVVRHLAGTIRLHRRRDLLRHKLVLTRHASHRLLHLHGRLLELWLTGEKTLIKHLVLL